MSQSTKDALADAEALERLTRTTRSRRGWAHTAHRAAIVFGWCAQNCMHSDGDPRWAYNYARTAAHSAFRACPGLR